MDYKDILYKKENGVATITINRPERHNAFRYQTLDELVDAFEDADGESAVGVIVVTGAGGKAFCSGGDVEHEADFTPRTAWILNRRLIHLSSTIRNSGKPVIARVDGWCVGGGNELNLLCDLTIASERSKFAQSGPKVGSVPVWWGTQLLPRVVGDKRAKEIVMMCRHYTAQEAEHMGWINKVVPHEELDATVAEWCQQLLQRSPTALRIAKLNLNFESDQLYPSMLHGFRLLNMGLHGTEEQREGMTAFLEKRPPDFEKFRW